MSDDQHRTFLSFSQKITHRPIQRSNHFHSLAAAGHQRKRARNFVYFVGGGTEDDLSRRFGRHAKELVGLGLGQIHDSFDIVVLHAASHEKSCLVWKTNYTSEAAQGKGCARSESRKAITLKKMDHSRIEWPIGEAAPKDKLLRHCVRIASLRFALRSRFIALLLLRRTALLLLRRTALLLLRRTALLLLRRTVLLLLRRTVLLLLRRTVLLLLRRTVLLRSAALLLLWRRPGRTLLLSRWRRRLWGARMLRNRPIDCVSASVV